MAVLPAIAFSQQEHHAGVPAPARVEQAVAAFREHGAIRLRDLLAPEWVRTLDRHYRARYRAELLTPDMADRRRLFSVDLEGPFAQRAWFAHPLLFPILERLLGADCILGASSSVVSWPGAPPQTTHRDSESLYGDFAIDVTLPPYAVTLLMPLVRADAHTGSTRVWPGTHRVAHFETARAMESVAHEVEVGSALLTDSRVLHGGEPNGSDQVRPLLYNSYHRVWFRDFGGYERRPPVSLGWRSGRQIAPADRAMLRIADENAPLAGLRSALRPPWRRRTRRGEGRA